MSMKWNLVISASGVSKPTGWDPPFHQYRRTFFLWFSFYSIADKSDWIECMKPSVNLHPTVLEHWASIQGRFRRQWDVGTEAANGVRLLGRHQRQSGHLPRRSSEPKSTSRILLDVELALDAGTKLGFLHWVSFWFGISKDGDASWPVKYRKNNRIK